MNRTYEKKPKVCPNCKKRSALLEGNRNNASVVHVIHIRQHSKKTTIGWICMYCGWYEMYYTFKKGKMVLNNQIVDYNGTKYKIGNIKNKKEVYYKK